MYVYMCIYMKRQSQILIMKGNDSSELSDVVESYRLWTAEEEFVGVCIFTSVLSNLLDIIILKINVILCGLKF